ncbi:MAG: hypothetical protein V4629_12070 [Pseudomonadota bacterium]
MLISESNKVFDYSNARNSLPNNSLQLMIHTIYSLNSLIKNHWPMMLIVGFIGLVCSKSMSKPTESNHLKYINTKKYSKDCFKSVLMPIAEVSEELENN